MVGVGLQHQERSPVCICVRVRVDTEVLSTAFNEGGSSEVASSAVGGREHAASGTVRGTVRCKSCFCLKTATSSARPARKECAYCRNVCNNHFHGTQAQIQQPNDQHIKDTRADLKRKSWMEASLRTT